MMRFALEYRKAIDSITADKAWKLRQFELDHDEWQIVRDLVSVLEVSAVSFTPACTNSDESSTAIQKGDTLFFQGYGKYRRCHPSHG
jgi:hypothetical protein